MSLPCYISAEAITLIVSVVVWLVYCFSFDSFHLTLCTLTSLQRTSSNKHSVVAIRFVPKSNKAEEIAAVSVLPLIPAAVCRGCAQILPGSRLYITMKRCLDEKFVAKFDNVLGLINHLYLFLSGEGNLGPDSRCSLVITLLDSWEICWREESSIIRFQEADI